MIPTQKITAAGLAGAVVTVALWVLGLVTDLEVTAEVASALTVLVSVGTGYLVRETRPPETAEIPRGDVGQANVIWTIVGILVAVFLVLLILGYR